MTNVIGIDPTVDYAFKRLLGSPEHSRVTIHFLNAILRDGPRITRVEFQNPFLEKEFDDDKLSILDILAIDEHGRRLNIEMQTSLPAGLEQRLAYYDAILYVDQIRDGDPYYRLRPAIVICVLSVPLFSNHARLHSDFRLRDASGLVLTDDLQIHTLELTKLTVTYENLSSATPAECWACFLRNAPKMTVEEVRNLFPEPEFVEAAGVLEMISQTPGQMHEYAARMKLRLDDAARLQFALQQGHEQGHERGLQEGLQEGLQQGLQQGLQEGLQQGMQQGIEQGLEKGKLLGRIAALRELLSISTPKDQEMSDYDLGQLTSLWEHLRDQFRQRGE